MIKYEAFDILIPRDNLSCADSFARDELQHAIGNATCYDPALASSFPKALGFHQGMQVVRWQDNIGRHLCLGVKCGSSLQEPSVELQTCINGSETLHAARNQWSVGGRDDVPLKGHEEFAFCAPDGTLSLVSFKTFGYRCSSGAQSDRLLFLTAEVNALKGIRKFAYFRCLSCDELFGVYVGAIGVLITVAIATTTLCFTDVARPLLQVRNGDWSLGTLMQSACEAETANRSQLHTRKRLALDVVLRCAAALALGSALGMGFFYVPWQVFLVNQGQACDAA